jgi:hypothetical protein
MNCSMASQVIAPIKGFMTNQTLVASPTRTLQMDAQSRIGRIDFPTFVWTLVLLFSALTAGTFEMYLQKVRSCKSSATYKWTLVVS